MEDNKTKIKINKQKHQSKIVKRLFKVENSSSQLRLNPKEFVKKNP